MQKLPTEINTIKVDSIKSTKSKKGETFFAIFHEGKPYFLGKSLKKDGLPNVNIGDYVRIGYYLKDDNTKTYVAYATGSTWTDFVLAASKVEA